jgi:Domain of unknown function DUF11
MKVMKSFVYIVIFLMLLSSMGNVFAVNGSGIPLEDNSSNDSVVVVPIDPTLLFSGSLSVQIIPTTAHVNDTVQIIITATNNGMVDWCPLTIYAPVPEGLQFVSFVVPGRNLQNYNPSTGIWDVYRMRHIERGQQKTAIITAKVLPSAAGKPIIATAQFQTLVLEGYGVHMEHSYAVSRARPDTLTVVEDSGNGGNTTGNTTGNGTGNKTGDKTGDVNGNNTGNGSDLVNSIGNSLNGNILTNLNQANDNTPIKNLQTGGGSGGGKGEKLYEISKIPPISSNDLVSYIIAVLLIIGLIVTGYFYGIKRYE